MNINLVLSALLMILIVFFLYQSIHAQKHNSDVAEDNRLLEEKNKTLKEDYDTLSMQIENRTTLLNQMNDNLKNQKNISEQALENYFEVLEKKYEEEEEEYEMYKDTLQTSYSNLQLELMRELQDINDDLEKMRKTRAAAYQAQAKEKEIQENKDDYRLDLSEKNLRDIKKLKSIQDELSLPIVVDKIIWSNYYQPIAKTKFPKIIGKSTTCGIYKITSLVDGGIYIGQSSDIYRRWSDHAKSALGVGTSAANNKLYKTMKEQGLYNFTFEVLEECPSTELDEKERYYISLYDSCTFGMNSNKGISK